MSPLVLAFCLTLLAGAATVVGGLLAVHRSVRTDRGLAVALGFAGGAMVLVSVLELVPQGVLALTPALGGGRAWLCSLACVAVGALVTAFLGRAATHAGDRSRLRRSGVVVALAVTAHNLPEGLATFVATLHDPAAGVTLAAAIALHNVPEGVAVAAPCFGTGGSRWRAVGTAGLSGLAEPLGALLGWLVLAALLPAAAYGVVFGLVAGVMVQIGVTELVPSACRLVSRTTALVSCAAGGASMALSLVLLRAV